MSGTRDERFDSEPLTMRCFTEDFAHMVQLFNILTEKLDFSQPFRMIVDYDPEQPRVNTQVYMPTEVLEQHKQRIQAIVQGQKNPPNCNDSSLLSEERN